MVYIHEQESTKVRKSTGPLQAE
jgi:hypothetical protein